MWIKEDSSSSDNIESKIIPLKSISTNILTVRFLYYVSVVFMWCDVWMAFLSLSLRRSQLGLLGHPRMTP